MSQLDTIGVINHRGYGCTIPSAEKEHHKEKKTVHNDERIDDEHGTCAIAPVQVIHQCDVITCCLV